ncbi:DUF1649-domain-containing protein [Ascodesmis nigricans]|uniref:Autophagy-related protein 101 n=1 Tax=Ascodesmis nigricans TaxID=341454 RepID=A0A4S2MX09_9PEZI|nr:DUF1649-domain-containing protein [Ascodesmis nigricans]
MERPPVFTLEVLADRTLLNDVVKGSFIHCEEFTAIILAVGRPRAFRRVWDKEGVLYTIFFHRLFSSFRPSTRDLLDLTLPSFDDAELDDMINQRLAQLMRSMEPSTNAGPRTSRGQLAVRFYEKRPRKASWFAKAEEKVCWEQWTLNVTVMAPSTDSSEKIAVRKKIERQLEKTLRTIIATAGSKKDHVPPITSNDSNPFPYAIVISPKDDTWGARMGIFHQERNLVVS